MVVLLPGGRPAGTRRPLPLVATAGARAMADRLTRAGRGEGLVAHVVRYRYRGWNGAAAHPAYDAEWAVDEVVRRYGDIPVCLVGTGIGGRAALRAAGHPAVRSVVALAPWFPQEPEPPRQAQLAPEAPAPDPVQQLSGRQVLIVHGTADTRTRPELSYRLADRARKVTPEVCRFEVHTDDHALRQHWPEVLALTANFVLGSLCGRDFARPLADAMAAPPPLGLRMPLGAGFSRSLR